MWKKLTFKGCANDYFLKAKKSDGITLITLVVTIVILLILAGIAISGIMGENGLFIRAKQARQSSEITSAEEDIKLRILEASVLSDGAVTKESFLEALNNASDTYLIELASVATISEDGIHDIAGLTGDINVTNITKYPGVKVKVLSDFTIESSVVVTPPSGPVIHIYEIALDNKGATTPGTSVIYETYESKFSKTSDGTEMTTSSESITVPEKTGYVFKGYYTEETGGEQYINAYGYLTNNATASYFSDDGTLYAQWRTEQAWDNWLKTASIDNKKYNSLNDFITNGTQEERQTLGENASARSYLISNSSLITSLKSTTDYGSNMASYLLRTNSTLNTQNYNAGLPCYVFKGSTIYLGGTWVYNSMGNGSKSTTSDYVQIALPAIEGWANLYRSGDTINIAKFSKAVVKGYVSTDNTSKGYGYVAFGTKGHNDTQTNFEGGIYNVTNTSLQENTFDLSSGSYYFGINLITFGSAVTGYFYHTYLY